LLRHQQIDRRFHVQLLEDAGELRVEAGTAADRPELVAETLLGESDALAAGDGVLVDEQGFHPAARQQGGACGAPESGADDDDIIFGFHGSPFRPAAIAVHPTGRSDGAG